MNIFRLCAAILQDFGHPKNRCWHTQLNVCEKEGFPCFLYLIQIFVDEYTFYLAPKKHEERNRHKDRQKYLIKIHPTRLIGT